MAAAVALALAAASVSQSKLAATLVGVDSERPDPPPPSVLPAMQLSMIVHHMQGLMLSSAGIALALAAALVLQTSTPATLLDPNSDGPHPQRIPPSLWCSILELLITCKA